METLLAIVFWGGLVLWPILTILCILSYAEDDLHGTKAFAILAVILFVASLACGYFGGQNARVYKWTARQLDFDSSENILKGRIRKLSSLHQQLKEKEGEVIIAREAYQTDIGSMKTEIKTEAQARNIKFLAEALNNQRISYDLALLQKYLAYVNQLNIIQKRLQEGQLELEYFERNAAADLRLTQTLPEDDLKKLTDNIDAAVAKYLPAVNKLSLNAEQSLQISKQDIWNEIFKEQAANEQVEGELSTPSTP
ncbi:MAG: hypothetical protein NTX82_03840 [Candidatus Parcubacteria bacterium]|nr:hypothetical protein [Candidatus Parcubacteria bacterium]